MPAMPERRKHVTAHTDGSCETQTGHGGWAYLLEYRGHRRSASGYEADTTNNRMELTAAVRALEALSEPCAVTIVTDSQYLKKAFTDRWLDTWQRNGWRTASRQPVKNQDLWRRLLELGERHDVRWRWTRGHAGNARNVHVDRLALTARRERRGSEDRATQPSDRD
jgi:ribonuclease HI